MPRAPSSPSPAPPADSPLSLSALGESIPPTSRHRPRQRNGQSPPTEHNASDHGPSQTPSTSFALPIAPKPPPIPSPQSLSSTSEYTHGRSDPPLEDKPAPQYTQRPPPFPLHKRDTAPHCDPDDLATLALIKSSPPQGYRSADYHPPRLPPPHTASIPPEFLESAHASDKEYPNYPSPCRYGISPAQPPEPAPPLSPHPSYLPVAHREQPCPTGWPPEAQIDVSDNPHSTLVQRETGQSSLFLFHERVRTSPTPQKPDPPQPVPPDSNGSSRLKPLG